MGFESSYSALQIGDPSLGETSRHSAKLILPQPEESLKRYGCADPERNIRAVQPGTSGEQLDFKFGAKAKARKWTFWMDRDPKRC